MAAPSVVDEERISSIPKYVNGVLETTFCSQITFGLVWKGVVPCRIYPLLTILLYIIWFHLRFYPILSKIPRSTTADSRIGMQCFHRGPISVVMAGVPIIFSGAPRAEDQKS